jgi:hypothetical protein
MIYSASDETEYALARALSGTAALPASSGITHEEAAAMLRAAFNLFERWQVTTEEARVLLGHPSPATFYRWKGGDVSKIPHDTAWRLGELMGIHKALRYMFRDPERAYAWVRKPNTAFGGQSALQRMLAGAPNDLTFVRSYLDAERGGW